MEVGSKGAMPRIFSAHHSTIRARSWQHPSGLLSDVSTQDYFDTDQSLPYVSESRTRAARGRAAASGTNDENRSRPVNDSTRTSPQECAASITPKTLKGASETRNLSPRPNASYRF